MRYLKPHFYDQFTCTAGDCPDTCCAGWQIVIDEDSLERYGKEQGEFGKRLRNSIDWEEECFYQKNRRCAFLNDENLCDLYKALGPDALCDTCRLYPRHTEEYEGLRELSLSLSCPEAARIILSCQEPVRFLAEETDEEDDYNIRCNAVLPGLTATDAALDNMPEQFIKSFLSHVPLNRMGTPEDMANAVLFFASDDSSYVTGHIMEVSGGYHLGTPQYADFVGRKVVEEK